VHGKPGLRDDLGYAAAHLPRTYDLNLLNSQFFSLLFLSQ
jgi:hypothetical protein